MSIEIPDQRLVDLEAALDEILEAETRAQYHHTRRRKRRYMIVAPEIHTALVMRALYAEAARNHDLAAPLAGAVSFHELKALTGLEEPALDLALNSLLDQLRLRTRFDAVNNYRIYFLPAFQRGLFRKVLLMERPTRILRNVRIDRAA